MTTLITVKNIKNIVSHMGHEASIILEMRPGVLCVCVCFFNKASHVIFHVHIAFGHIN